MQYLQPGTPVILTYGKAKELGLKVGIVMEDFSDGQIGICYLNDGDCDDNAYFEGNVDRTYTAVGNNIDGCVVYPTKPKYPRWILCYPRGYDLRSLLCDPEEFQRVSGIIKGQLN